MITAISRTSVSMRSICALFLRLSAWKRALAGILFLLLTIPSQAAEEAQHEFLFFPSVEWFDNSASDDPLFDSAGFIGIADLMYSYSGNRFRFLAEYMLSNEERELERVTAGWLFGEQTMLWVGRFHQPSKYWSTEYHHGQYMQTSISRPGIEEWEDDGGSIPSHISGVLLETGKIRKDSSGVQFSASAGFAPALGENGLEPFEPWAPSSDHGLAFNFRLAFLPDYFGTNQFGILGGWSDIEIIDTAYAAQLGTDSVEQFQLGAYVDWRWERLRIIFNLYYLQDKHIRPDGNLTDNFFAGYLQAEFAVGSRWTVYGRYENTAGGDTTDLIRLIPKHVSHRYLFGVRLDMATNYALTLEIADTETVTGHLDQFRLQLSAGFP